MWEKDININQVFEIRTRTTVFFGCGAIEKIDYIVKNTPINFRKKFDALIDTNGTGDFVYSISRFLENPERMLKYLFQ